MHNETDKAIILSELERILSAKESIFPYKESLKGKVADKINFEDFYQKILKLSNLFDNYLLSASTKSYELLVKQVIVCNLSEDWLKGILGNAGIETLKTSLTNETGRATIYSKPQLDTKNGEKEETPVDERIKTGITDTNVSKTDQHTPITEQDSNETKYKFCNNCRKTIKRDIQYCPYCGKVQKMKNCWVCRRIIPFGAVYCPYCNSNNSKRLKD